MQRIIADINSIAVDICTAMDYEVSFTELDDADQIIKLLNFCIDKSEISFAETLLAYMKLNRMFFGKKLTAIYNLKACMSTEELELFYKSVKYEKLPLLLVEDIQRKAIPADERTVIIDEDLCVI